MRRSISIKLVSSFFAITLLGAVLTVLFARLTTVRDFRQLVLKQAQEDFGSDLADYYREHDSWLGAWEEFRHTPGDRLDESRGAPVARPGDEPLGTDLVFALADADGNIVLPASPYEMGDVVAPELLAGGAPVLVEGTMVGTALTTGRYPDLSAKEQEYLDRTTSASLWAALAATLVALILGVLVARSLTSPIRRLTVAARMMARGQLDQRVTLSSKDELGQLASAFNQMSADLQRTDEERRQMTADVAHELRTPLTVISGYLEGLREGVLRPTETKFEAMYLEAQHLMHLVDDLRTLSLSDTRSLPLTWDDVAPRSLLDQVALVYGVQAEKHRVEILVDAGESLPNVCGDTDRLLQVMGNLVSNALRYSPAGGTITLAARRERDTILLSVHDTGSGIAPDELPHVFDRFYRGQGDDPEQNQTGLGLAIARSLVELHGGTISADSVRDEGSAFTIRLPIAR